MDTICRKRKHTFVKPRAVRKNTATLEVYRGISCSFQINHETQERINRNASESTFEFLNVQEKNRKSRIQHHLNSLSGEEIQAIVLPFACKSFNIYAVAYQ